MGSLDGQPFCLVMTSEIVHDENLPPLWRCHLPTSGKTCSIDFMIGSPAHLGCGLAGPTLHAFGQFMSAAANPTIETLFIDPADTNPRTIHVYAKAGFQKVGEFTRRGEDFCLMVYRTKQ